MWRVLTDGILKLIWVSSSGESIKPSIRRLKIIILASNLLGDQFLMYMPQISGTYDEHSQLDSYYMKCLNLKWSIFQTF
jgi:intracellular septation protein A